VNSLNELEYYFDLQKLGLSLSDAQALVKNRFKAVYTNNSSDLFDILFENQNLKNSLGWTDEVSANSVFNSMINDMNSILYNFIKIE
jgi:hypothetical protein